MKAFLKENYIAWKNRELFYNVEKNEFCKLYEVLGKNSRALQGSVSEICMYEYKAGHRDLIEIVESFEDDFNISNLYLSLEEFVEFYYTWQRKLFNDEIELTLENGIEIVVITEEEL